MTKSSKREQFFREAELAAEAGDFKGAFDLLMKGARLGDVLGGDGRLAERMEAYRAAEEIPPNRLAECIEAFSSALRDRVRATAAVLSVSATCLFYLQQVDDPDKLRAIVLEMATDLTR